MANKCIKIVLNILSHEGNKKNGNYIEFYPTLFKVGTTMKSNTEEDVGSWAWHGGRHLHI